jgi:hypothetical protein
MGCNPCSTPDTPDYGQIAKEQGAANLNASIAGSNLSNPNTFTPYGSQQWTETGYTVGSNGEQIPNRPTLTQTLSPAELEKLNLSNKAQATSLNYLNQALPYMGESIVQPFGMSGSVMTDPGLNKSSPIQTQFDYASAPGMPVADKGVRDQVSQAFFDQGSRFLLPQFQQQQTDLDTMMANQGITRGSEAQGREQGSLDSARTQQMNDLASRSVVAGGDAMSQLYGMQMGARQQGIQETTNQGQFWNAAQNQGVNQLLANQNAQNNARQQAYTEYSANRTMPINMLNALISSSQVNNPNFQPYSASQVAPAPILQGAQLQDASNTAKYNSQMGLLGSLIGGGSSLAASALTGKR